MIFPFVFKANTNPNFTKDQQLLDLVDQLNKNKVLSTDTTQTVNVLESLQQHLRSKMV